MNPEKGYYSLIQYCPDRDQAEVANIGVVLLCPARNIARAKASPRIHHVEAIFGKNSVDEWWLKTSAKSFVTAIHNEQERLSRLDEFERFIATRGNEIILTPPRVTRVTDPASDLNTLFSQLVDRAHAAPKPGPHGKPVS